jgi:glyoxylase-like metal-dependent hydrolase (beta-lactamase superfamily II)
MAWHTTARIKENLYCISEPFGAIEPFWAGPAGTVNMYLVVGQERAALIDSGMGVGDLRAVVGELTALPCIVLNTHSHWDHVGGNRAFAASAIHAGEADLLTAEPELSWLLPSFRTAEARAVLPASFDPETYHIAPKPATQILKDNDLICLGGRGLRVLHTPGHSPGHVAFWDETNRVLFTGDTVLPDAVYACFEDSDLMAFEDSVKRLAALPGVTTICPGHNDVIVDRDWLGAFAACVRAAVAGEIPEGPGDAFIDAREFRCGGVSIWLPR